MTADNREGGRMSGRHWLGEALAAFDQALANLSDEYAFGSPEFWIARAQAAATIASAEQARIANLIAWKALRQAASSSPSSLPNAGDAIADEIEASLGILERPAGDPAAAGVTLTPGTLAAELAADAFLRAAEDRASDNPAAAADLRVLAERLEREVRL